MKTMLRYALVVAIFSPAAILNANSPSTCSISGDETADGVSYNRLVSDDESVGSNQITSNCAVANECNSQGGCCGCENYSNCSASSCYQPVWTVDAGAVILNRSTPKSEQIIRPVLGSGSATISNGTDFGFDWSAGPDITITRRMDNGNSWQVRYFEVQDFTSNTSYGAVGNFQLGSFSNFLALDLTGHYTSDLNSVEINWLHPFSDRVTWLVGFRWLELEDALRYEVTFPISSADYHWDENNQLYGAQTGFDLSLWNLSGPFTIDCLMKAGFFGNSATNRFNLSTLGVSIPGGADGNDTAFIGELDLTAAYQFSRHIAVHGGYELLWVDGVALSSNQAATATAHNTQNSISSNGDVFYHGALVSLDVLW
jgi:hypothetical protein